jgi:hypothetical protein
MSLLTLGITGNTDRPVAGGPPFTFIISSEYAGSASGGTTPGVDTTGANIIVIGVHSYAAGNISDSNGNTWTALTDRISTSDVRYRLYYCINPTVGAGHTFSTTATFGGIVMQAFSSSAGTPVYDQESGNVANSVTSIQPGSITPSVDDCLIITGGNFWECSSNPASCNSGVTVTEGAPFSGGVNFGYAGGYLIQGTAAAINPTWSWSTTATSGHVSMAVFKPS